MKLSIKAFIAPKLNEKFSDCADYYAVNKEKLIFAISDGVSRSFFPKIWSRILAEEFAVGIYDEKTFVSACQKKWQAEIDERMKGDDVKYYTRNAYVLKTPAAATLATLKYCTEKSQWDISALGDSFVLFIKDGKVVGKFSSNATDTFDNYPDYIPSIGEKLKGRYKTGIISNEDGIFLLMTDALSEWFLQNEEEREKLLNLNNQEEFEKFVRDERSKGRLKDDDTAVIIIDVSDSENSEIKTEVLHYSNLTELITNEEKNDIVIEDEGTEVVNPDSELQGVSSEEGLDRQFKKKEISESPLEKSESSSSESLSEENTSLENENLENPVSSQSEEEDSQSGGDCEKTETLPGDKPESESLSTERNSPENAAPQKTTKNSVEDTINAITKKFL